MNNVVADQDETLKRERLELLQEALTSPSTWSMSRRQALQRLTAEAGTRSIDRPSEADLLMALRRVAGGQSDHIALARRIVADGHPHDLYLLVRGEQNLETLLSQIVELQPGAANVAVRVGLEMRLDGALIQHWLRSRGLAA